MNILKLMVNKIKLKDFLFVGIQFLSIVCSVLLLHDTKNKVPKKIIIKYYNFIYSRYLCVCV